MAGNQTSSLSSGGIGFFGLSNLAIVFITLKLNGVIHWSWWLVLLPAYGGILLLIVIAFVAALIAILSE